MATEDGFGRSHEESRSMPGICHVCREPWPCMLERLAAQNAAIRARAIQTYEITAVGREPEKATLCHLCSTARVFWFGTPLVHTADCPLAPDSVQAGETVA